MLSFNKINIESKEAITAFTFAGRQQNCDFAFANMCSWHFIYKSEYAICDNYLFIRFYVEDKGHKHLAYMFPAAGRNNMSNMRQAIELIEKDAEAKGHPLLILGVTPDAKKILDALFPNSFTYTPDRNHYDYIYLREDMTTLKGKKFQPKRNHINKFRKSYNYLYRPITPDLVPLCMKLEQKWYEDAILAESISEDYVESLSYERQSMTFAMEHFDELGLTGGMITVDDEIAAFTYGSPINHSTFGIHVEKADIRFDGIFSVINQEFALRIPPQYTYVNREEDLGIAGLRQAKMSYHPALLLEKNTAFKRR